MSEFRRKPPKSQSKGKKKHWQMSPLKYLARQVVKRRGRPFPTHLVTAFLVKEFKYAFDVGWNVSIGIEGRAGEGKSEVAQSLALFLWLPLTGGEFHYFFDIDETPDSVDGDFQHLDEWIISEGAGKIQAINRYRNICNVSSRAKKICNSVSSPQLPDLSILTIIITMLAQERNLKINLVEVRYQLPRVGLVYLGNAEIPLHNQAEIRQQYEEDAYERKTSLLNDKGSKKIKPKVDRIKTAEFVLKWAREHGYKITTKGQAASVLMTVAEIEDWDINYDEESRIANLMTAKLDNDKLAPIDIPEYTGQTIDLKTAVLARIPAYGIENDTIEYLKLYLKGNLQSDIAEKFGITQPTVSDHIGAQSPLREGGILGYSFEDVWKVRMEGEGHIVHKGGSNTPDPDLVFLTSNIPRERFVDEWWLNPEMTEHVSEVHSVKCYLDKKPVTTIPFSEVAKSELALMKQGKLLTLVYYDIYADKLFRVKVKDQDKFSFKKKV
ncbi:MAG: hypothetical protein ACFFEV_10450 [Candidatus Thorarchaeota archaeon]